MSVGQNAYLRIVATIKLGSYSRAQNVYHVKMDTAADSAETDVLDAALEYVEAIMTPFSSKCVAAIELETVDVYEYMGSSWSPVGTIAGTWKGTGTGSTLASGLALIVNAYKPRSGYADKKYFGGFIDGNLELNTWQASIITAAESAGAAWVADFDNTTVQFKPCSFDRVTGVHTEYSGAITADTRVSYQRRRKPGVGLT